MSKLTHKDFSSDQEIRWCPGCGDYAILKALKSTFVESSKQKHEIAIVSGIGCAARMPYYLDVYGLHTIHGRAIPIAQGLIASQPDLDTWVISGDGDLLSIGLSHLIHAIRFDQNFQIVLLNNEIYGLTKGQVSPTSRIGTISSSTLGGSTALPINPLKLLLSSGCSFIARAIDVFHDPLVEVLLQAQTFYGTSFVEILQNCPIYNQGIYNKLTDPETSKDNIILLKENQKMVFGLENQFGLKLESNQLVVTSSLDKDILIHNSSNFFQAFLLACLKKPTALGVIYKDSSRASIQHLDESKINSKSTEQEKITEITKIYNDSNKVF